MKKSQNEKNVSVFDSKKTKRKKIILVTLITLLLLPILILGISIGIFEAWANGVNLDESLLPTQTALPVFYDSLGEKIDVQGESYLAPEDIPTDLKNAFVALEDKRFYSHKGYDPVRIVGALVSNAKSKSVKEGASTITQQLVKNTHLTQEKTVKRKLKEIAIAKKLEKEYTKDEILAMYLSVIYFGNGAYGVKDAGKLYFSKDVGDLSLAECATLAGIVKNPKKYSPLSNPDDCKQRRNLVLSVMQKEGYLSKNEYDNALGQPLNVNVSRENVDYLATYVKKAGAEACKKLGITQYQLNNSGYDIYTNLDSDLQKAIVKIGKDDYYRESDDVNRAIIVIDNLTHEVVASYSSVPYEIKAQAGSVLKPIAVFAPAIDQNLVTLSTPIIDEKVAYSGYSPRNFNDKYYGDTTIEEGIKKSMNSVALKTMSYVGLDKSAEYISNFGVNLEYSDKNMALALGATANGVSPYEVAKAYSVFASGGNKFDDTLIDFISKDSRKVFVRNDVSNCVIKRATADIMTYALCDTANDGTARTLSALPFQVAAKTGTAQRNDTSNSDAWCASFNQEYTVVVWHGSEKGMNEKGGGLPAKQCLAVWKAIADRYTLSQDFEYSDDVTLCDVDEYATKKNKTVMLASENTPIEYRKQCIFSKDLLPASSFEFEKINSFDFDIRLDGKTVEIVFDSEPIYEYHVFKNQFDIEELVCVINGNDDTIRFTDTLVFPSPCTYKVRCAIKNNQNVNLEVERTVYPDYSDFYYD